MQTVLVLAAALLAPIAFFAGVVALGWNPAVPVVHLAVTAGAGLWLAVSAAKAADTKMRLRRGLAAVLALFWLGAFAWYLFDYSNYAVGGESREARLVPELVGLSLADSAATPRVVLEAEQARATLVVLYRGYW